MCDHGTAPKVTSGIQREFHSAVLAHLPDLTDEEMQLYICHKEELGHVLRALKRQARSVSEPTCNRRREDPPMHDFYGWLGPSGGP